MTEYSVKTVIKKRDWVSVATEGTPEDQGMLFHFPIDGEDASKVADAKRGDKVEIVVDEKFYPHVV